MAENFPKLEPQGRTQKETAKMQSNEWTRGCFLIKSLDCDEKSAAILLTKRKRVISKPTR